MVKKRSSASTTKKLRTDRTISISQHAFEILEAARNAGHKKTDFASEAISAYARERLGSAIPASPAEMLEARLEYLERVASKMEWDDLCTTKPKLAKKLRQLVAEAEHSPYSRNFEALNKQRQVEGKNAVKDIDWVASAFAEKFKFPFLESESKGR